jgi:uncharacterized protein
MKCPVCADTDLLMAERQGVEIDYCPKCRGIWLDRGELDKIIERSASEYGPARAPQEPLRSEPSREDRDAGRSDDRDRRDDRDRHDDRDYHGKSKKKGASSFLGDILGGLGGD